MFYWLSEAGSALRESEAGACYGFESEAGLPSLTLLLL